MSRFLDGVDDYIKVGNYQISAGTGAVTLWFRWQGGYDLYTEGKTDSATPVFEFYISSGNLTLFIRNDAGSTVDTSATVGKTYNDNKWHHFALNNTPTARQCYIDGERVIASTASIGTITTNTSRFGVLERTDFADHFKGYQCEASIYNRLLSQPEIKLCMKQPGAIRNGLIGYWAIHGNSNPEPDFSVRKNHATIVGGIKGAHVPLAKWR